VELLDGRGQAFGEARDVGLAVAVGGKDDGIGGVRAGFRNLAGWR
jgi:hypothetical protein